MAEQRSFNDRAEQLLQELSRRVGNAEDAATPVVRKRARLPLKLTVRS